MSVGVPMGSRSAAPPKLEEAAKGKLAQEELAPKYRAEMLKRV